MVNRIFPQRRAQAISDGDRLSIATLLVKMGYAVRLTTIRDGDKKPVKAIEYGDRETMEDEKGNA